MGPGVFLSVGSGGGSECPTRGSLTGGRSRGQGLPGPPGCGHGRHVGAGRWGVLVLVFWGLLRNGGGESPSVAVAGTGKKSGVRRRNGREGN